MPARICTAWESRSFEMLAGRLPWDETDIAELIARKRSGRLPSVRSFAPHVPSELGQLVGSADGRRAPAAAAHRAEVDR